MRFDRPEQQDKVVTRFKTDRDEAYGEFIDKCADFEREIRRGDGDRVFHLYRAGEKQSRTKLRGWLEKTRKLDLDGSARVADVKERRRTCERLLGAHAKCVFEFRRSGELYQNGQILPLPMNDPDQTATAGSSRATIR